MTTTTHYYGNRYWEKTHWYKSACGSPDTIVYDNTYRKKVVVVDNPPERRPKPEVLVPDNLTGQDIQERKTSYTGFRHYSKNYSCPTATSVHYEYKVLPHEGLLGAEPTLDWQTKMREDIEEFSVSLGETLAEYRETCRMFGKFGIGMRDAFRKFKKAKSSLRGRPNRKRITPCSVGAAELQYSYGVAPLASVLYDSVELLTERLSKPVFRRFTSFDSSGYEDSQETFGALHEYKWEKSERAIAYVQLEPDARGFDPGNPLEWAWEIIPFSFVVDWGIPIGQYLGALDALKNVEGVKGTVTTKRRFQRWYTDMNVYSGDWYFRDEKTEKAWYLYESHKRDVITSIPLPRVPRWDPSTSWKAVMHGLSLLTVLNQRCQR